MHRDIGARQGVRARRLFAGRSVAELASAIVPVMVGVILAFAWNTAGSYRSTAPTPDPGLSPGVEVTAEQAAAQAWARVTPAAMTGNSPRWQPRRAADRESAVLPSITAWPAQVPASRGAGKHLRDPHAQRQRPGRDAKKLRRTGTSAARQFPPPTKNPTGTHPPAATCRLTLYRGLENCDIPDEHRHSPSN